MNNAPYVISADLETVKGEYVQTHAIEEFRATLTDDLEAMGKSVEWVNYSLLRDGISKILSETNLQVISLDERYVDSAHHYLGISRSVDATLEDAGYDARIGNISINEQLDRVGAALMGREAVLVDDVVFSGENACWIIDELGQRGVKISAIVCGVAIGDATEKLSAKGVELAHVELYDEVEDEICERDFAFVKGSGRKVKGREQSALYFDGQFGRPAEWASINPEAVERFCVSSIVRNQKLLDGAHHMGAISNFLGYDCSLTVEQSLREAFTLRTATS